MMETHQQARAPSPAIAAPAPKGISNEQKGSVLYEADGSSISDSFTASHHNYPEPNEDLDPCRKADGRPGRKRTWSSAKSLRSRPATRGSRKRSLSLLVTMPLDVVFEVFSLLSLKDLLSLIRTNKSLRKTLMARSAITVWKAVREGAKVPAPPQDISESRWAALLFGGPMCEWCGTSKANQARSVDFALRRRLCILCKKDNYVAASDLPAAFPDLDRELYDLTPYTDISWANGFSRGKIYYWKDDIHDVAKQWGAHQTNILMHLPGAEEAMQDFRNERLQLTARILQEAETYKTWYANMSAERASEDRRRKEERWSTISAKFKELGYLQVEINTIRGASSVNSAATLTERAWTRIRPNLEQLIIESKRTRLAREREIRLWRRKDILEGLYKSYLRTLVPWQWFYHPPVFEISAFPIFAEIISAADDVEINEQSFVDAMTSLPGTLTAWLEDQKAVLREYVSMIKDPRTDTLHFSASPAPSETAGPSSTATPDILELATSVFQCGREQCSNNASPWLSELTNPLFGWSGLVTHACEEKRTPCLVEPEPSIVAFFEEASAVAAELVRLAGLDVAHATVADMDQQGHLFFCSKCMEVDGRRPVYVWRSAVCHATSHRHPLTGSWELVPPEAAGYVDRPVDPIHDDSCWSCNHCSTHFDAWTTEGSVRSHLNSMHDILNALEPVDLFHHPGKRRSQIGPTMIKMQLLVGDEAVAAMMRAMELQEKAC